MTDAIDTSRIPGVGPVKKKLSMATAREMIAKHKKSCAVVCIALLVIAVLVIVAVSNSGFSSKMPWSSPDMKLLKKNHTGDTRRSDNKIDGWSKDDYAKSVAKFNSIASAQDD